MRIRKYRVTKIKDIENCERIRAGISGGGKLFTTEISDAMRIRTGQRGEDAH